MKMILTIVGNKKQAKCFHLTIIYNLLDTSFIIDEVVALFPLFLAIRRQNRRWPGKEIRPSKAQHQSRQKIEKDIQQQTKKSYIPRNKNKL